jgi:tetratricopeptide (TPR) repeat protein
MLATSTLAILVAFAQAPGNRVPVPEGIRQAIQFDLEGNYAEAQKLLAKEIEAAANPRAKANAQRTMAMSYAFAGDCKKTGDYEQMVIEYWRTREKEEPANAFYQQGEMANEAARVCIDLGDLEAAERWYKLGAELGLKEPGISADRSSLWKFRLLHAEARLAARRGQKARAEAKVKEAKAVLETLTELRKQQEVFFPYLTGYVALYTGNPGQALADLQNANQNDPFIQILMAAAHERLGAMDKAKECYEKAYKTTAHNPPAAIAKPLARKKLS